MIRRVIFADDPARGWRPWGLAVPFLGIGFVIATVMALTAVLQRANLVDADENPIGLDGFAAFLTLPFAALGLVVLAWVAFVERRPLRTIGLTAHSPIRTFLYGHLTGVGMATGVVAAIWAAGGFVAGPVGEAFRSPASLGAIAILLAGFVLQSSVEELVFRGWMLSAVAAKFGTTAAVIASSAVFTLLHFDSHADPAFWVNVALFALFACSWALRTGSVWGLMGWHAGWNWILAVGFQLRVTKLDAHTTALFVKMIPVGADTLTGGVQGPEGSVLCGLVLGIGIVVNVALAIRNAPASPAPPPPRSPAGT